MSRTWIARDLRPPWKLVEVELAKPFEPLSLSDVNGAYLLFRHKGRPAGRCLVGRSRMGAVVAPSRLAALARAHALSLANAYALSDQFSALETAAPLPPLTVAVCTRNRAALLRRTLEALVALRDRRHGDMHPLDILVVDNAPVDVATRQAAAAFPGVRYVVEPIPGLNFGRNRAIAETDREFLGFIDDDALPDCGWLDGFAQSLRDRPDAGAFTGPVLPMKLETEAHIRFEAAGGFGAGIDWQSYHAARWGDPIYPAGAGRLCTGANMIFRTETLRMLGGFDEALDTGPPLPGGGDVDICYRVVRSGAPLIYAPRQAVHHEHREDMPGLRRQFRSWGLSIGALLRKNHRTDPERRRAHLRLIYGLLVRRYGAALVRYPLGRGALPPHFVLAEMFGLFQGLAGEYRRSQARVAKRKEAHAP